jgi:protein-L-isoaspartate(D-aspartate) O-methyltransferase
MADFDLAQARFNMIEQQVRTCEVLDQRVLDAFEQVPRERFVSDSRRKLAYADLNLPLEHGEFMLSPVQEGRILQALALSPNEQVLEIGTGSGYLTACLAKLARHVTSVDLYADFLSRAASRLDACGLGGRVRLERHDAATGWDDGRHYDAIAVTGSLPELHRGFHEALAMGGRLVVFVGTGPVMETLLITRVGKSQWFTSSLFDSWLPPLRHLTERKEFAL